MKTILSTLLLGTSVALGQSVPDPATEGPKIAAEAFAKLSSALGSAIVQGGPAAALPVCNEQAPRITAEVAQAHGVTLRRATVLARNPKNAADETERAVLAEFAETLAAKDTPKAKVVSQTDGSRVFFAPIVLANPLCLQCHGRPEQDVSAATLAAIRAKYPEDKATGYRLGELRGLWRIDFPAEAGSTNQPATGER
jgi:hypothetical protein